jgi:hypothetical protein
MNVFLSLSVLIFKEIEIHNFKQLRHLCLPFILCQVQTNVIETQKWTPNSTTLSQ